MSATGNAPANTRRMLRWTTLAGLLAATVALGATPAAANDWDHRHHGNEWGYNGYGYDNGYYRERPRYYHRERRYYYQPAPNYYYYAPPPAYYYPPPPPRYYEPSFSFGLTIPIH